MPCMYFIVESFIRNNESMILKQKVLRILVFARWKCCCSGPRETHCNWLQIPGPGSAPDRKRQTWNSWNIRMPDNAYPFSSPRNDQKADDEATNDDEAMNDDKVRNDDK